MDKRLQILSITVAAVTLTMVCPQQGFSQYATTVTTVEQVNPRIVGYKAEPFGLFGLRTVYRPVYAPTQTVTVTRPVVVDVPARVAPPASVRVPTPVVVPKPSVAPIPFGTPAPLSVRPFMSTPAPLPQATPVVVPAPVTYPSATVIPVPRY